MKRRVIINVSMELLRELLELDSDIEIIDAKMSNFTSGTIDLLLTGKGVPECEENSYPLTHPISTYFREVKV